MKMSELKGQEHAITFTEVDLKNDGFITHLTLCIGKNYEEGLKFFNQIKESYPKHEGEPEMIIDFIDTDWSLIDDYPITKENAIHLAMRMGHVLKNS
jgi:hypothetical protein